MPDADVRELATDLQFPEGPVWLPDGDVLLVEVRRGTLTRVKPDGTASVVAEVGGGPNGAAVGPDGAVYIANNGGFVWSERNGIMLPVDAVTGATEPPDFQGGWIERVDLATGAVTVLYRECDGDRFLGPNDLVFDDAGGFWFTDFGKSRRRSVDKGSLYYARPDGSSVVHVAGGLYGPNGVGLSPDGDRVYVAESYTGRLLSWDVAGPGEVRSAQNVVVATPGHFDSLAVEADGTVVVAALNRGLCVVRDQSFEYVPMPDPMVTNICFGGDGLRTAFLTFAAFGKLVAVDWPRPGLALAH